MGRPPRRAVVTVGIFDGVHRAHQQLIRATIRQARRLRGTSVIITFDPDPQAVLHPAQAQPALMPFDERLALMRTLGIEWVWVIPFTRRFSRLTARQFIDRILIGRLHAAAVILGARFVFGRNRHGDMEVLRAVGSKHGLQVITLRQVTAGGVSISSSRIRRLITEGKLSSARRLLGRAPSLDGTVVRGAGRGRRLGFPTANIRLSTQACPPRGVYAVQLYARAHHGASRVLLGNGVMNLGVRPTFGPGPLVCEVHLLKSHVLKTRLLGRSVSVSLLARLRAERRFSSPQALVRQVRRDITRARRLFATR